jgi:hypothetical protein
MGRCAWLVRRGVYPCIGSYGAGLVNEVSREVHSLALHGLRLSERLKDDWLLRTTLLGRVLMPSLFVEETGL